MDTAKQQKRYTPPCFFWWDPNPHFLSLIIYWGVAFALHYLQAILTKSTSSDKFFPLRPPKRIGFFKTVNVKTATVHKLPVLLFAECMFPDIWRSQLRISHIWRTSCKSIRFLKICFFKPKISQLIPLLNTFQPYTLLGVSQLYLTINVKAGKHTSKNQKKHQKRAVGVHFPTPDSPFLFLKQMFHSPARIRFAASLAKRTA